MQSDDDTTQSSPQSRNAGRLGRDKCQLKVPKRMSDLIAELASAAVIGSGSVEESKAGWDLIALENRLRVFERRGEDGERRGGVSFSFHACTALEYVHVWKNAKIVSTNRSGRNQNRMPRARTEAWHNTVQRGRRVMAASVRRPQQHRHGSRPWARSRRLLLSSTTA